MAHKNADVFWAEIDFDTAGVNPLQYVCQELHVLDCDSVWSLGCLYVIMFQLFLDFALILANLAD